MDKGKSAIHREYLELRELLEDYDHAVLSSDKILRSAIAGELTSSLEEQLFPWTNMLESLQGHMRNDFLCGRASRRAARKTLQRVHEGRLVQTECLEAFMEDVLKPFIPPGANDFIKTLLNTRVICDGMRQEMGENYETLWDFRTRTAHSLGEVISQAEFEGS